MDMLNKKSGLLGISGFSSDIRDIIQRVGEDAQAKLAFEMYVYRLKKYVGSYVAVLGGVDVLVFTDDIGVHNWLVGRRSVKGWTGAASGWMRRPTSGPPATRSRASIRRTRRSGS